MSKVFVVLGIILLFAGVIVASASTMATETPNEFTVSSAIDAWEVSGLFDKNEKLLVSFTKPDLDKVTVIDTYLVLRVEVTGPQGSKTVFRLEFRRGFGGETMLYNLTVILNEDGLTTTDPWEVGGIVPYNGTYIANITTRKLGWGPPDSIVLDKEVFHREYPYLFVLPIGISIAAAGSSLLYFSVRSSKHKLRPKTKKS